MIGVFPGRVFHGISASISWEGFLEQSLLEFPEQFLVESENNPGRICLEIPETSLEEFLNKSLEDFLWNSSRMNR